MNKYIVYGLILITLVLAFNNKKVQITEEPVVLQAKIDVTKATDNLAINTEFLRCIEMAINPNDLAPLENCKTNKQKAQEGYNIKYK